MICCDELSEILQRRRASRVYDGSQRAAACQHACANTTHHEVAHIQCIMRVRLTCERCLLTPKAVNLGALSTGS
jgi:hypothetical protein